MKGETRTRRATGKSPKSSDGKRGVRKWEPHLAIPAAYMYSMGASDHEVAFGLGVTHPTVTYWLKVHPEFRKAYSRDLMNLRRRQIGEAAYRTGMASLAEDTHQTLVGRWILNFCQAAC